MDANLATVLVAVVTGVFSLITYRMKRNENLISGKVDQQSAYLKREAEIRKAILEAEKKRNSTVEQMMMFLIKSTSYLLLTSDNINDQLIDELQTGTMSLEISYKENMEHLAELYKEHDILIDVIRKIQKDIAGLQKGKVNEEIVIPDKMKD